MQLPQHQYQVGVIPCQCVLDAVCYSGAPRFCPFISASYHQGVWPKVIKSDNLCRHEGFLDEKAKVAVDRPHIEKELTPLRVMPGNGPHYPTMIEILFALELRGAKQCRNASFSETRSYPMMKYITINQWGRIDRVLCEPYMSTDARSLLRVLFFMEYSSLNVPSQLLDA